MKLKLITAHGVLQSYVREGVDDIPCNAYCKGDVHCDLIYAEAGATEELVVESIGAYIGRGAITIRVERAGEAPPLSPDRKAEMFGFGTEVNPGNEEAWLHFWRKR